MSQIDSDYLKISHLEARMRGATELHDICQFPILSKNPNFSQTHSDNYSLNFHNRNISSNSRNSDPKFIKRGGLSITNENQIPLDQPSKISKRKNYLSMEENLYSLNKKIKLDDSFSYNLMKKKSTGKFTLNDNFFSNELINDSFITEDKENEKNHEIKMLKQQINTIKEEFETYKTKQINFKSKLAIEIEDYKRKERKKYLFRMKKKLGEFKKKRVGVKFNEVWEDGVDILDSKCKLNEIKEKQNISTNNSLTALFLAKEKKNYELLLEKLENEKSLYQIDLIRLNEEENSYFYKSSTLFNNCKFPLLKNRYQVLSFIGRGGFSDVYKGLDLETMNDVAIKIHYVNPSWTEEMKATYLKHSIRESEVHKSLDHPNIVKLYDTIPLEEDSFCSILEYCDGSDLGIYLKKLKNLPENEAKIIIFEILKGIKYLHMDYNSKMIIIHYDLKPQNILFKNGVLKITDFGLCKVMDNFKNKSNIELTLQGAGTYWYLPPECFEQELTKINHKVDIWSLGVIFFELVYGKKPFGDKISQEKLVLQKIILNEGDNLQFPTSPSLSNLGKFFIKRCLTYKEDKRWDAASAINFEYFI